MATRRISIINWSCKPALTTGATLVSLDTVATNDVWKHLVWQIVDTASSTAGFYGTFEVPQNYPGTPSSANIVVIWTTTATSNDAKFQFKYRAVSGNDTESLDQAGQDEAVSVVDTAPSAAWERMEGSITLTHGNFTAGDTVEYQFWRNPSDLQDNLGADTYIFNVLFEYDDGI